MEGKLYAVEYKVTTHHEAIIMAPSKVKAREKVVEVIGEPVTIYSTRQLKPPKSK